MRSTYCLCDAVTVQETGGAHRVPCDCCAGTLPLPTPEPKRRALRAAAAQLAQPECPRLRAGCGCLGRLHGAVGCAGPLAATRAGQVALLGPGRGIAVGERTLAL